MINGRNMYKSNGYTEKNCKPKVNNRNLEIVS